MNKFKQLGTAASWCKKNLQNFTEDDYREILRQHGATERDGRISAKTMTLAEQKAALAHMQKLGFPKPKPNKNKGPRSRQPIVENGYKQWRESQGDKIRALWLTMFEQGIVRSADEAALRNYIRRMTHNKYSAPQFCPPETASRIIEALKKWQKRGLKEQLSCK